MIDFAELRARASTRETWTVDVEEWGGSVTLREMTGAQRMSLGERAQALSDEHGVSPNFAMLAVLVAMSVVDDNGESVFAPDDFVGWREAELAGLTKIAQEVLARNAVSSDESEEILGN